MADRIVIQVIVDNYVDVFVPSTDVSVCPIPGESSLLWAEHGLSLLAQVSQRNETRRILYDFGKSQEVFVRNSGILTLDLGSLDDIALSHGHFDHYGALRYVLSKTHSECKLMVHPQAYGRRRFVRQKTGVKVYHWDFDTEVAKVFDDFQSRIVPQSEPVDLGMGALLSGEIKRSVTFEKGMPNAFFEEGGVELHDELLDDQSLIIELERKGLVVISGCCHAGVVNTLKHTLGIFPGKRIYALIGGLHLNNASGEQMDQTIQFLLESGVRYISGLHCTGYYAKKRLMDVFPDAWIPLSVGGAIVLAS
ncbi:MAG: MBL fold metallo-hydrolase [Thermodesulfobacteriota bacterium]